MHDINYCNMCNNYIKTNRPIYRAYDLSFCSRICRERKSNILFPQNPEIDNIPIKKYNNQNLVLYKSDIYNNIKDQSYLKYKLFYKTCLNLSINIIKYNMLPHICL